MDPSINEDDDPILQMRGVGKEIWADTDADEYVRSLRANWYSAAHDVDNSNGLGQISIDLE
jgi:hypothetical protein